MFNIYMYQNKINGKVYVGQTIKTLDIRCNNGLGYKECPKFYNSIKKYGLNNFDCWAFKVVSTKEEADQEEIFWIAEMRRQLGKSNVFNLTDGGDGSFGFHHTEESKEKISNAKKQYYQTHNVANKGIPMSDDQKQKLKVPKSEEHNRKNSESHKGQLAWNKIHFTNEQILSIKNDKRSNKKICKDYGVSDVTIGKIKRMN